MKLHLSKLLCIVCLFSAPTFAKDRLEVYKDYDIGTEITLMTTVKVDPNMEEVYLAGLAQSWVKAVKLQKKLGFIKDWKILGSDFPLSGDFNLILIVTFENSADMEPSKKKYMAFMDAWGKENNEQSQELSAKYPEVRTLTGEYVLREVIID
ncbi:hypothetical protein [Paraglaciecola marina]|uniref:hypothetical protein n=1 Tax=Paraglaciecola marina TaxID=2500157 RepID=UPI00105C57C0|nr:hypothetical protein [Paraglaciecola marina]